MQDRKKIYSEQLLQIHTDSKKRNPGKEIYATGYVIELKKDCYFAGFKEGKILCRSLEYARYFFNIHSAEQFVKEYLGYAGLRCNLCKVAWGLAVPGMEPGQREELKPYEKNGRVMNFPSYHDGVKYQKTHHLEKSTPCKQGKRALYCCIKLLGDNIVPLFNGKKLHGREKMT